MDINAGENIYSLRGSRDKMSLTDQSWTFLDQKIVILCRNVEWPD